MACKQLGLQYTEMNASDARNKKILDNRLLELLGNTQINQFYGANKGGLLLYFGREFFILVYKNSIFS
jgi:hypothetical protein